MARKAEGISLSEAEARRILREAADDSRGVFIVEHPERRMKQRRITRTQVQRCLRHDVITEPPA